jgi:hypothetical protein
VLAGVDIHIEQLGKADPVELTADLTALFQPVG